MLGWLRKFGAKRLPPLQGAPAVRRQKTYSAQSGYVYVYYYQGCRTAERGRGQGIQFVFEVTADRKTSFSVPVFLAASATEAWERTHRELSSAERYAIAKMALFQAFDERPDPARMRQEVVVRSADAELILETLEID